ncbi:MAG: hypothetical protein ACJ0Q1_05600 [Luminiphilus sp.]
MQLYLSESMITGAFWPQLQRAACAKEATSDAESILSISNVLARDFPGETGSMSLEATKLLWLLGCYFAPKVVIEVGTYIGRSTAALFIGARPAIEKLYTCDATFDAWDPGHLTSAGEIEYFGKTTSTQMFEHLVSRGVKADLFFLDGRLQDADLNLVPSIMHNKTVFLLDDFEGLEKGVVNGIKLRDIYPNLILIRPNAKAPDSGQESPPLALLVPPEVLQLSRQQSLPIRMM